MLAATPPLICFHHASFPLRIPAAKPAASVLPTIACTDVSQTVMIPLGGIGSRFQSEGYAAPKPFVKVFGTPMIVKVIESLKLKPNDALVIVYNPAFLDRRVWAPLKSAYPALTLVELGGPTRGAAETVLIGLKGLPRKLLERPVMLVDGDCFYDEDILSMYRAVCSPGRMPGTNAPDFLRLSAVSRESNTNAV